MQHAQLSGGVTGGAEGGSDQVDLEDNFWFGNFRNEHKKHCVIISSIYYQSNILLIDGYTVFEKRKKWTTI